jgi:hypothetical protein
MVDHGKITLKKLSRRDGRRPIKIQLPKDIAWGTMLAIDIYAQASGTHAGIFFRPGLRDCFACVGAANIQKWIGIYRIDMDWASLRSVFSDRKDGKTWWEITWLVGELLPFQIKYSSRENVVFWPCLALNSGTGSSCLGSIFQKINKRPICFELCLVL